MQGIVGNLFSEEEALEVLSLYRKPQVISEEYDDNTLREMSDIIEEMAEADGANATDIVLIISVARSTHNSLPARFW